MEMFKKARDQLMQTVGLSERMPSNPQLTQSAEKLKQMNSLIAAMRKSVESYASSMLAMGDASRILASDISRFYRDSSARTKTVGLFTSAMVDQESNVLFLFKEQFGWDVSREFDQWMAQSHSFRNRVDAIDNEYSQLNAINVDARTFGAKRDQLDQAAKALSVEISRFLDARYARFDKIFIRLMEFQKEFFHEGVEVTDKFDPVVKQYRNKVSLSGGATPTPKPTSESAPAPASASASVSNGYGVPSTSASPSPSSTTSPTHVSGERLSASASASTSPVTSATATQNTTQKPTSIPTPVAVPTHSSGSTSTPTYAAPSSSFDILGLSSPASPSASQAPTKTSGNVEIDLFGGLFSSPSQTTSSAPIPASSSNVSSSFDILGMNAAPASSFSSRTSSTSSSFDFSSFATNSTSAPTASKTTSSSTGFDADFFSSTTSTSTSSSITKTKTISSVSTFSTSIPASSSIDDIDDHVAPSKPSAVKSPSGLDDDMLSGFTYASSSNSNTTGGDSSFDMFDPLSSNSIMSNSNPTSASTFQHQELPRGAEMSEAEEQNAIHEALSTIEPMIHNWRFKNGMEKEVPGLLASLTTVLWEGHNWKKVDITNLLEYNSVKKSYRRALLTVHPDKVAGSTPLIKATAERVFEVLNNAFKQYEIKMGMRSAN